MSRWRQFFPLKEPRGQQADALDRLVEQVDAGERTLVLEAGTGVGKSAIAVTLANYINTTVATEEPYTAGAYVLTSQKILQDQYLRDFPSISDIRSSANFSCHTGPGETCGQTMRYKSYTSKGEEQKGPSHCVACPYRISKDAFKSSPIGITNYSYFMSEVVYAGELSPRKLLVLDEAHNVESEMRRWGTFSVDEQRVTQVGVRFPFGCGEKDVASWLMQEYRPAVISLINKQTEMLEKMTERQMKKNTGLIDELDFYDKHLCSLNRVLTPEGVEAGMLVNWDERKDGLQSLHVQPLNSGAIARDFLYPRGKFVLLMSATLLDEKVFKRSAGLTSGVYVTSPTPFPAENFGIVYRPIGRMAKNQIQRTMPKMVDAVRKILRDHPTDKGIIHCSNYEVARAIGSIGGRRLLVQNNAKDREEMLRKHRESRDATVLVSPSMMEGLDLEGDLGRFQVICKLPFPNMGDPVVAAKMNSDRSWYAWCTSRSLIQAIGRCVRSMDDSTKTYILDESFGNFFEEWIEMFPQYFMQMDIEG